MCTSYSVVNNALQSCASVQFISVLSFLGIVAVGLINEAIDQGNPAKTLEALLLPTVKLQNVRAANAWHYQDVLKNAKTLKCQVRFFRLSFLPYK